MIKRGLIFFQETFLQKKLNNWLGYVFIALIALLFGFLLAKQPLIGIGIFGGVVGLGVVLVCLSSAEAGLYIILTYSFFAFFISRLLFKGTLSVGVIYDLLILITFLGLFAKPTFKQTFSDFSKSPIVVCVWFVLFYMAIEFFNPNSSSLNIWFLAFRKFLGYNFLLFIAYNIFSSYSKIERFITVLFFMSFITAFYGCLQQWHGYFNFEMELIMADPQGFGLIFINGEFRKFSTMSDPAAYGILMAVCAVFYLIIASNEKDIVRKIVLIIGSVFMILGMAYSGTRTAYAIIVAGLAFFIILNFDKKSTRIFGIIGAVVILAIIYGPFYGKTIDRFRTTFVGSADESYKVRVEARHFIQPYILSHPIGGGLGTTGGTGAIEQPNHYLANFQPDSSYLKKATETGWVGLGLFCVIYFITLKTGIKGFFRSRNQNVRILFAASLTSIFSFYVGEYAQVALGQITDVVVYYPLLAIILKLGDYDDAADSENKDLLPSIG